jgi:CheY-like chemotaxis protein
LIEDLLDITRMESGRLTVNVAPVEPQAVVSDLLTSHRPLAAAAQIELQAEICAEVGAVAADRDRLTQVLENLVGNAIKFSLPGGRVTIAVRPDGAEARFIVQDQGVGISADQLPHIFDRFWQAGRTDTRGVGLGLAIVQGIIEAHGRKVCAQSAPGRGTTFSFTLPQVPQVADADALAAAAREHRLEGARFALVAEDDVLLRETLCERLREAGFRTAGVANGAEALELVRRGGNPDLIILDLEMPVMDGRTFLQARERDPALASIPVVAISGKFDPSSAEPWGAAAWLRKPLNANQLLETVERVVH